jgi:ArsR family transcriptional regulator, arsenate/arsenite/antimonite-responsive transcriptional repressor
MAFEALADPTRRRILRVLADLGECSAGDVADRITGLCRTAVSTHLRVLLAAELVRERRAGRYRFYSLDPEGPASDVLAVLRGFFGTG